MSADDAYAAAAGAYDLFNAPYRDGQLEAVKQLLPLLRPEFGPILDIGAGSGVNVVFVLEHLADARVCALEPSTAMRSLTLARIAEHPEWFDRVTVWPEDFFAATLPAQIGGAIMLGVIGHFDSGERAAVFAELAARLPAGGAALFDLQSPERPRRVEPYQFTAARVGDLTYSGIAEAWPLGIERMRWRMSYLTLERDRVLVEETAEYDYRHPAVAMLADEAGQVGLSMTRIGDSSFWLLRRD